jgi:hypothetical protein
MTIDRPSRQRDDTAGGVLKGRPVLWAWGGLVHAVLLLDRSALFGAPVRITL